MSKADTNQSSEDELRAEILTEFKQVHKLAPADYTENCTNVVMGLIRAEKLKLLAEVRERVVGEDDEQSLRELSRNMPYEEATGLFETNTARNVLKDEQRNLLTKLEANQ